jgi:hypothetical protein
MLYSCIDICRRVVCRKVLEKRGPFMEVPLISEQIEYSSTRAGALGNTLHIRLNSV